MAENELLSDARPQGELRGTIRAAEPQGDCDCEAPRLRAAEPDDECCETPMDSSRMKNINIHALDYGYNVKIGCQNFAVETPEKLIKNLEAYLKDPNGTERKWLKNKELL